MFEAKSMRGINTHKGHMQKDQIYKRALCDCFYNNKEELDEHYIQETLVLHFGHVQPSLRSKFPSCEIHFMTEKQYYCSSER